MEKELIETIWGKWECPYCGDICEDPNDVFETTCSNGHMVKLGIVENGFRAAYEQ